MLGCTDWFCVSGDLFAVLFGLFFFFSPRVLKQVLERDL